MTNEDFEAAKKQRIAQLKQIDAERLALKSRRKNRLMLIEARRRRVKEECREAICALMKTEPRRSATFASKRAAALKKREAALIALEAEREDIENGYRLAMQRNHDLADKINNGILVFSRTKNFQGSVNCDV